MKLIVGLGNPGTKYEKNRHNIGFRAVEYLAKTQFPNFHFQLEKKFHAEIIQTPELLLVKPQTFMNESGKAVETVGRFYKIKREDLYIVHDDLDITLGKYKIQFGRGPQIHNGLLSIEQELGTDQFWNVRIGVENREVRGNKGVPGVVYSLQDFRSEEDSLVEDVIAQVGRELKARISKLD